MRERLARIRWRMDRRGAIYVGNGNAVVSRANVSLLAAVCQIPASAVLAGLRARNKIRRTLGADWLMRGLEGDLPPRWFAAYREAVRLGIVAPL